MTNAKNQHTALYTSKVGAVRGYTVKNNHNIKRSGGSRKRRRRGGGFGFNPKGKPSFGIMPIKSYNNCGIKKNPDFGIGKQHAPLKQFNQSGGYGPCKNGGTPFYGFTKTYPSLYNTYAPATPECHGQCGGRRRRVATRKRRRRKNKRRKKSTNKKLSNTKRRSKQRRRGKRRATRHKRRRRRRRVSRQRGGYTQFAANVPSTPGYATPYGGNWQTANPPTFARNDACGTGNCVDNYNHFTGKGFRTPVFDKGVTPAPAITKIKTPNYKGQCGSGKRRKRRRH